MPSGRVREFDIDDALDRAIEVFWRRGYEGATLDELTKAMKISRPSMYSAFGNKEQLFRKALERYREGPLAFFRQALGQSTAQAVVEALFSGVVREQAGKKHPPGCLIVQAALTCGEESEPVRRELAAGRERAVAALCERFEQAVHENDLPAESNCAALARYVVTILHGLAVQAASGATRKDLQQVVHLAIQGWPRAAQTG